MRKTEMQNSTQHRVYDRLGLETMRKWSKEIIQEQTSSTEHQHPWADVALVLGYLNSNKKGASPTLFVNEELFKRTALYCLLRFLKAPDKRIHGSEQNCAAHALNLLTRSWESARAKQTN
jgi:predicted ATPase